MTGRDIELLYDDIKLTDTWSCPGAIQPAVQQLQDTTPGRIAPGHERSRLDNEKGELRETSRGHALLLRRHAGRSGRSHRGCRDRGDQTAWRDGGTVR